MSNGASVIPGSAMSCCCPGCAGGVSPDAGVFTLVNNLRDPRDPRGRQYPLGLAAGGRGRRAVHGLARWALVWRPLRRITANSRLPGPLPLSASGAHDRGATREREHGPTTSPLHSPKPSLNRENVNVLLECQPPAHAVIPTGSAKSRFCFVWCRVGQSADGR